MFKELVGYLLATVSMVWSNCILWSALRGGEWHVRWFDVPPLIIAGIVSLIVYGLIFRGLWCVLYGPSGEANSRLSIWVRFVMDAEWRRGVWAERRQRKQTEEDARRREKLIRIAHRCKAERLAKQERPTQSQR